MPTLISWIKGTTPFNTSAKLVQLPFGFCWCRWKFSYGGWCCYTLKFSRCTRREGRTWRNVAWCECLSMVVQRKSSTRMVRTWIDRLAWDRQLCPNPHALTIYLEFVPAHGATLKRFKECQCEDDDVHLHCRTWVPNDGHYHWLRGPINPLPMDHRAKYLAYTICRILDFLQLWFIPLKSLTKL